MYNGRSGTDNKDKIAKSEPKHKKFGSFFVFGVGKIKKYCRIIRKSTKQEKENE